MPIRIPHSSPSRREKTYATLILRVSRRLPWFEGCHFATGALIDERELHPTPDYPTTPLLVEYAGTDGTKACDGSGWGHKRLSSIHVVWQFDAVRKEWNELARTRSYGSEMFQNLAPLIRQLIAAEATPESERTSAAKASARILETLDSELDRLEHDGRSHLMSFLYDQFTARMIEQGDQDA
jgi:hypothetical protein